MYLNRGEGEMYIYMRTFKFQQRIAPMCARSSMLSEHVQELLSIRRYKHHNEQNESRVARGYSIRIYRTPGSGLRTTYSHTSYMKREIYDGVKTNLIGQICRLPWWRAQLSSLTRTKPSPTTVISSVELFEPQNNN